VTLSIAETQKRFLACISLDSQGGTKAAIAELVRLVPDAHADLVEIVMLELMRIFWRIGDNVRAHHYARKIAAIDSDPPPSVRKVLRSMPLAEPSEPDYVSGNPGEHIEFADGSAPDHFYAGKRRFDVRYREGPNGVWYASSEVFRAKNRVLYDPNHAPFDPPWDEVYDEEAERCESVGCI
jgi:hypothetical protein